MRHSTLFLITGILGLFFGLCTVLMPGAFYEFYGGILTDNGKYAAQLQGAAYLGFALLFFFAAKAGESKARTAIVVGAFIHFLIGLVVSLKWQIAGVVNAWGWTTVAIFALLSIGYLYLLLKGGE